MKNNFRNYLGTIPKSIGTGYYKQSSINTYVNSADKLFQKIQHAVGSKATISLYSIRSLSELNSILSSCDEWENYDLCNKNGVNGIRRFKEYLESA